MAAYNGLSENSQVVLGATVMVPTTVEGYAALQKAGLVAATPATATGTDRDRRGRRTAAAPAGRWAATPSAAATRCPGSPPASASPPSAIAADERPRPGRRCCSPAP